jgi:uncharacterized protein (DUF2062 family)
MYYTTTITGESLVWTELTCANIRNSCARVSARTVSITWSPVLFGIVINTLIVAVIGDLLASSLNYLSLLRDHPLPWVTENLAFSEKVALSRY